VTRGVLWRLQGERLRRREARKCQSEPHPAAAQFWERGDWSVPDTLRCGRCFAPLAQRPHRPAREEDPSG
jgi:hypothetical protein